jgi:CheY-like chemotaxis protein
VIRLADGHLEQVLLNLAVNARDATRSGGTITVSTRREAVLHGSILHRRGIAPGAWAVLEVKDTGVGMDESTRAQAFEPHFTTKAARGGSGLGLATVGGIARAAGGHVFVETAPDAGTTMTVFFPAAAEAAPAAHPEAASPPLGPHAGALLVVDDEPLIRSAVARYLTHLGYRVIEAADVAQAISRGEQHGWHVDLVLTDVIMPDATGPVLAERVRQRRPGMPVLFMTGHLHGASRQSPADIPPVEDTIYKPFDLHTLAERVRVKLAQRR